MEKFVSWFFDHFSTMIFVIVVYGVYFVISKGKKQLKKRCRMTSLQSERNVFQHSFLFRQETNRLAVFREWEHVHWLNFFHFISIFTKIFQISC